MCTNATIEFNTYVDLCYIDCNRAVDCITLLKLVFKLLSYCFSGFLLTWMSEFLTNEVLCVKIINTLSNIVVQTSGISQVSCLECIFFVSCM